LVSGFRLGETEATTMSSVDTIMNDQGLVDSAGVESVPALLTANGKGHRRKGTKAADRRRGRTGSRGSLGQGQGRVGRGGWARVVRPSGAHLAL